MKIRNATIRAGKQKHWDIRTFSYKEHERRDFSKQRKTKKCIIHLYKIINPVEKK